MLCVWVADQVPPTVGDGQRGSEITFAAWCRANPDHVLPEAILREIAELRSELGVVQGRDMDSAMSTRCLS